MSSSMTYAGYTARVEFDDRDNIFWGKIQVIAETALSW